MTSARHPLRQANVVGCAVVIGSLLGVWAAHGLVAPGADTARVVNVTPVGPNAVGYWGAAGLGYGRVASPEALSQTNTANVYRFRYAPSLASATLLALPYKTGSSGTYAVTNFDDEGHAVVGETSDRDSFFYVWAENGQQISLANHRPATATSSVAITLAATGFVCEVGAIFSREYRSADNMGDINQDGIPDVLFWRSDFPYHFPGFETSNVPYALANVASYNGDNDYLPVNPTGLGGRFDFRAVASSVTNADSGLPENAFTALLEIRGLHPGLNNAEFGGDPDFGADGRGDEPHTAPVRADSDGDLLPDGWEYYFWYEAVIKGRAGLAYDPLNPAGGHVIAPDAIGAAFDPAVQDGASKSHDIDNDSLSEYEELVKGTSPVCWDTDGDGVSDGFEKMTGMNPCWAGDAVPTFTPAAGLVATNFVSVRLAALGRATIRYTLDGSDPTESSAWYTGKRLLLTESATVRARAYRTGMFPSAVATAAYTVVRVPACYYVDAARPSDDGDGTSWATAKRTLQAAARLAYEGDVVWVTNGVYCEGGACAPGGQLSNRVVIARASTFMSVNGPGVTIIEGSGAECFGTAAAVRCALVTDGVLDGFTLRAGATFDQPGVEGSGGGAFLKGGTLWDCVIGDCRAAAGGGVCGGRVSGSIIFGNAASEGAGACGVEAFNSVIYGNAGAGVAGGFFYNSIIWSNTCPYLEASCPEAMIGCCVASWPSGSAYRDNVRGDPLFANAAEHDVRLLPASPCRDAGDNAFVQSALDHAGALRVVNGRVDIGAHESDLVSVSFAPGGGAVRPSQISAPLGTAYGELPTPVWAGYTFDGWWTEDFGLGAAVSAATVVTNVEPQTLYARWMLGVPPVWRECSLAAPASVREGASVAFRALANDGADPDTAARGMSNITWYVDGEIKQVTSAGAPAAITSAFTLRTTTGTVVGASSRSVEVRAVARDRQAATATTNWLVRVVNAPVGQSLTFRALPQAVLGDPDFRVGATSSSGLPVAYSNSNPAVAMIEGGVVRIVGGGTTVITASQPGNFDFKAASPVSQTLTVKARLTTEVRAGAGSVSGAGLYPAGARVLLSPSPAAGYTLLRWEDGTQNPSRTFVMPGTNVVVAAWFGATTDIAPPALEEIGPQQAKVGVAYALDMGLQSDSFPSVAVSGLPSGLAYSAETRTISGVPRAAASNALVTVTAKNANPQATRLTFMLTVDPLPAWAVGTFSGSAVAADQTTHTGIVTLYVSSSGKVSGKFPFDGKTITLSVDQFSYHDDAWTIDKYHQPVYALWRTITLGTRELFVDVIIRKRYINLALGIEQATMGEVEWGIYKFNFDGTISWLAGVRMYNSSLWRDPALYPVLTNRFVGYYTASLPGGAEYGSGYLTLTVDRYGNVKTAGKLADGTSVSQSGSLVIDVGSRLSTALSVAPAAYQGGTLSGEVEFCLDAAITNTVVRPLGGNRLQWVSRNPRATAEYGEGFTRSLDLYGGRYDSIGNLYRYYSNRTIRVRTDAEASAPELSVGEERLASAWWRPDGVELAVVTNRSGVMTGLAAPRATVPADVGGYYDYEGGVNTVGLTFALTRATGIWKSDFKAWFDGAEMHQAKAVAGEGVLTPVRELPAESSAGRGFFLWPGKSAYQIAEDVTTPYGFSWSYDLRLLLSE